MKTFAVAILNLWFDDKIFLEIIHADNWFEALIKHSAFTNNQNSPAEWISQESLGAAKESCLDCDLVIDVKEVEL